METAAFLGVLGLGYIASKFSVKEGFANSKNTLDPNEDPNESNLTNNTSLDRSSVTSDNKKNTNNSNNTNNKLNTFFNFAKTPPLITIKDTFFQPAGTLFPTEPSPSKIQGKPTDYSPRKQNPKIQPPNSLPTQSEDAFIPVIQVRPDNWEDETHRDAYVSPLSGLSFKEGEFKHANMVPFFRGQVKQSLKDNVNNQTLDNYTGSGKALYAKREQTPFFEPTKEPIGNPFGFESTTEFMETRMVESRNRSNERPMESIRVGPGINQGFTHLPSGGYQQQSGEEYVIARMPRTNDLRVATNPKLTYAQPVVPGAHFITTSGTAETVGQVRKYNPDRFYINANGERNFVTVGADTKATIRSAQVRQPIIHARTSTIQST